MTIPDYTRLFSEHQVIEVGQLQLPSGLIAACDPYFCSSAGPFVRRVKPGSYSVQLCRADFKEWGPRIPLARLVFSTSARVVKFERAVTQDSSAYMVNSGTGSFMDEETRVVFSAILTAFYRSHPQGNYYTDILEQEFQKSVVAPGEVGDWALHQLPNSTLNVAMFSSGLGDGMFESFWGSAQNGDPVCLVTDFKLL